MVVDPIIVTHYYSQYARRNRGILCICAKNGHPPHSLVSRCTIYHYHVHMFMISDPPFIVGQGPPCLTFGVGRLLHVTPAQR